MDVALIVAAIPLRSTLGHDWWHTLITLGVSGLLALMALLQVGVNLKLTPWQIYKLSGGLTERGCRVEAYWPHRRRRRRDRETPCGQDVGARGLVVDDASWDGRMRVRRMLDDVALELNMGALSWVFSVHVHTLEWLVRRRSWRTYSIYIDLMLYPDKIDKV